MKNSQNSALMWAIFITLVVGIIVIAIPQYMTLGRELRVAQALDVAANLTAATAVNYTQKKLYPTKGVSVSNCKDAAVIIGNSLPAGYNISDKEVQSETITTCVLSMPEMPEIQFSVIGIS